MKYKYNEVEEILEELSKVVYAMEQSIRRITTFERSTDYINIPIAILRREINEVNDKIEHLKKNADVTYDEDVEFINSLLESNEGLV